LDLILFISTGQDKYLDQEGTLSLQVELTVYISKSSQNLTDGASWEKEDPAQMMLDDNIQDSLIKTTCSLLGDEKTSDVKVSVKEDDTVKIFYCHSKILSGYPSVAKESQLTL